MQWATSNDCLNQLEYTDMRCAQTHSHTLTHSERRWRNVQNNTLNHLLRAYLPLFFACSLALLLPPCLSLSSSSSSLVSFVPFNCWINLSLCVISYALQHTLSQKLCYIPCDHRTDSNYRLLTESRARAHTIAFVNNSVVNCWYKESTHSQALFECNTQIIFYYWATLIRGSDIVGTVGVCTLCVHSTCGITALAKSIQLKIPLCDTMWKMCERLCEAKAFLYRKK